MAHDRSILFLLAISSALAGCPAGDDGGAADSTGSASASDTDPVTVSVTDTDSATGMTSVTETDTSVDSSAGETGTPGACIGTGGAGAAGDPCTGNDGCASGVCTLYTDAPVNDDAVCGDEIPDCNTRITGTVFDFVTGMPVDGASVNVAGAIPAIADPANAPSLAMATAGADGRIDVTTDLPVKQAIGIIALVTSSTGYLTATGLAAPADAMNNYAVGTGNHDLWVVPADALTTWSDALATDPDVLPAQLPLGEAGGVVGLVRDATGAPIAGAVVAPMDAGSAAVIRYVTADNMIVADMTTETGVFLIIGPGLAEEFEASMGGTAIAGGTAGSANGAAFTLIMTGS